MVLFFGKKNENIIKLKKSALKAKGRVTCSYEKVMKPIFSKCNLIIYYYYYYYFFTLIKHVTPSYLNYCK